jgi:polar amino acid transport system substrate-binding protein
VSSCREDRGRSGYHSFGVRRRTGPGRAGSTGPKGKLRVGAYLGSPLSMVRDSKTREIHGLSIDLGKELAKRLDVPFEQVSYQRIADVLAGMKAGDVDFTVSNATPARAVDVNFSQR